jgi:DNA adenine methylase
MAQASDTSFNPPSVNFLRYPGGKRRMLEFLQQYLPQPSNIEGHYVEPFIGGGIVFFSLKPREAIISDINPDLIDLYRGIRRSPSGIWERYCKFGKSKAAYKAVRDSETPRLLVDRAARVLFLNRTCFKGMWRHNLKGKFNVGYGGQDRRGVISEEDLIVIARTLRRTEICCCDFEEVVDECNASDFIYTDPPYRPNEKEQINDHYVGRQFTFEDHRRLASALRRAKKRGVKWALTTSAHPDIVSLFKGNHITAIPRGTGRRPGITVANSGEVLITTYLLTEVQRQ